MNLDAARAKERRTVGACAVDMYTPGTRGAFDEIFRICHLHVTATHRTHALIIRVGNVEFPVLYAHRTPSLRVCA